METIVYILFIIIIILFILMISFAFFKMWDFTNNRLKKIFNKMIINHYKKEYNDNYKI